MHASDDKPTRAEVASRKAEQDSAGSAGLDVSGGFWDAMKEAVVVCVQFTLDCWSNKNKNAEGEYPAAPNPYKASGPFGFDPKTKLEDETLLKVYGALWEEYVEAVWFTIPWVTPAYDLLSALMANEGATSFENPKQRIRDSMTT
jgi:hypothetical protein